jgi:hypothetical protein
VKDDVKERNEPPRWRVFNMFNVLLITSSHAMDGTWPKRKPRSFFVDISFDSFIDATFIPTHNLSFSQDANWASQQPRFYFLSLFANSC